MSLSLGGRVGSVFVLVLVLACVGPVGAVPRVGETVQVSRSYAGFEGNGRSFLASISRDGRFVAFESLAVPPSVNGASDIFLRTGPPRRDPGAVAVMADDQIDAHAPFWAHYRACGALVASGL